MIASHDSDKPNTNHKAVESSAKELWMKVMEEKMESMKVNHVWELVIILPNH